MYGSPMQNYEKYFMKVRNMRPKQKELGMVDNSTEAVEPQGER
jgi:hypothetical protein